jgi:hypothetical protein
MVIFFDITKEENSRELLTIWKKTIMVSLMWQRPSGLTATRGGKVHHMVGVTTGVPRSYAVDRFVLNSKTNVFH